MNKMSGIMFCLLGFLLNCPLSSQAAHLYKEKVYQNYWCAQNKGIEEYKLGDDTRIDCLTDDYAIEVEFATKWAESVGQSLYYANMTNRKAGVLLILEKPEDSRFLKRLECLSKIYNFTIWTIKPEDVAN